MTKNPLLDTEFLKELDESRHKVIYAKIIALTFDEDPIETIEGRITGGTLSIDGSSAVRRTCSSLSIVAQDVNVTDYYWGLNTKFKLEIGIKSEITDNEIIWFPQGTFLITSFSTSLSTSGFNINISGQDKMCLLNGTIGGTIQAPTDFANIEDNTVSYNLVTFSEKTDYEANKYYVKDGDNYTISMKEYDSNTKYYDMVNEVTLTPITIKTIIRESIHTYAGEPYYNIIINDLDDTGLELLEYRADTPIYFLFENADTFKNLTLNGSLNCYLPNSGKSCTLATLPQEYKYNLVDGFDGNVKPIKLSADSTQSYYIATCEFGETAGYRMTDLTYAGGELEGQVGDNIASAVLDKIVNMLGDYQYYYNVDGQFVFERKGSYLNTSWDSLIDTEDDTYAENAAYASRVIYNFEGNNLISSISHNPQLNNIRNDFSVFGEREISDDKKIAIHARIAIDDKPEWYVKYAEDAVYLAEGVTPPAALADRNIKTYNWREIIYQMALDYYRYNQEDEFLVTLAQRNTIIDNNGEQYCSCPEGKTGYEQYYIDMEAFWRELYNPDPPITYAINGGKYTTEEVPLDDSNVTGAYEKKIVWSDPVTDWSSMSCDFFLPANRKEKEEQPAQYFTNDASLYYWNRNIIYEPTLLNFWFDFLDTDGEFGKYSIRAIGDRPKAVNDSDVNSIYYRTTPDVIFFDSLEDYNKYSDEYKTGYTYVILPNKTANMFTISAQGKTAKDVIEQYLYEYTYGAESISLSTIPIYYLEPNNRIQVYDENSKINGEYLVTRMSIPLTYSGTMSIEASKAPQRVI